MSDHRLTARQMARFTTDGYLRFDALVPDAINASVMHELTTGALEGVRYNNEHQGWDRYFTSSPAYLSMLTLPRVQGIIHSLVGPGPGIDHCAVHTVPAMHGGAQFWHADATIDPRTEAFDIQLFYFPHDTPVGAGGTLILPGSHFRRVHESTIARYQNIKGQVHTVCPAGTLLVAHHNLWHCGQPNRSGAVRYMVKLRLNPRYRQTQLFNAADLDHEDIPGILSSIQPWLGAEHRLEILQRLRLWRSLTGTEVDVDLWLSRLDNQPTRQLVLETQRH